MKIIHVVGARPNFMKIAPIVDAVKEYNQAHDGSTALIEQLIVHTGQHYDEKMSKLFFEDLGIPKPDINLEVGSGSHAVQTAEIMKRFEPVLLEHKPDWVLVVGDVNSTIACSLVAVKLGIKVVHVEAGLRSFDRTMPEEINRILTDSIADLLFITEESASVNLRHEGIAGEKIYFVGNVMIDTLQKHRQKAAESNIFKQLGLQKKDNQCDENFIKPYAMLTLHRPSNVDNKKTFKGILEAIYEVSNQLPVIFPVHPRTKIRLKEFGLESFLADGGKKELSTVVPDKGIYCIEPLGYLDFLGLVSSSKLVLTDSGGIQEETTVLGIPCVTMRENTERPVTVTMGTNVIAGTKKDVIISAAVDHLNHFANMKAIKTIPHLWDGNAAGRIVNILAKGE